MSILKWYSIILISLCMIINLIGLIFIDDLGEKFKYFIGNVLLSPMLLYLLMI